MISWFLTFFRLLFRNHFFGSLAIVLLVSGVISVQVSDRSQFADSELHRDVMARWGTPIVQPAPSVRYVDSGSVFNTLRPLRLEAQHVRVEAAMNYRKRGLVYFSGFDFSFYGRYEVRNPGQRDIDLVFVFPLSAHKNRVLLSDLSFQVNDEPSAIDLTETSDKLVWTGRLAAGEQLRYTIAFRGRGLDAFAYLLDPDLAVRDFQLEFNVTGGSNYDYQDGVVPAHATTVEKDTVTMVWRYASLESGVPVGLILPSEQSFDETIATMVRRGWAPFLLFFAGLVALGQAFRRPFRIYESYLLAAGYGLFFVLLAYLAAFTHFAAAYVISLLLTGALICAYLRTLVAPKAALYGMWLVVAFMFVPTLAVALEGYTGLIYTLEIAVGLAVLMFLTTRDTVRSLLDQLVPFQATAGGKNDS